VNVPASGWRTAVADAYAQLGKPYQWGAAGPRTFDCSGLTMMAWDAAGVYLPHLAQFQYNLTARIPLGNALPGDLIFYGTPNNVYHVGIYIGGGRMIDAPETGQNVSITSIYWGDLLGAGRVVG
jgi:cell wall-associated NlpC family hydrolase